jgi:hypothetical protein
MVATRKATGHRFEPHWPHVHTFLAKKVTAFVTRNKKMAQNRFVEAIVNTNCPWKFICRDNSCF